MRHPATARVPALAMLASAVLAGAELPAPAAPLAPDAYRAALERLPLPPRPGTAAGPWIVLTAEEGTLDGAVRRDDPVCAIDGAPVDGTLTEPPGGRRRLTLWSPPDERRVVETEGRGDHGRAIAWRVRWRPEAVALSGCRGGDGDADLLAAGVAVASDPELALQALARARDAGADPAACWTLAAMAALGRGDGAGAAASALEACGLLADERRAAAASLGVAGAALAEDAATLRRLVVLCPALARNRRDREALERWTLPETRPLAALAALDAAPEPLPPCRAGDPGARLHETGQTDFPVRGGRWYKLTPAGREVRLRVSARAAEGRPSLMAGFHHDGPDGRMRLRLLVRGDGEVQVDRAGLPVYRLQLRPPAASTVVELAIAGGWCEGTVHGRRVLSVPVPDADAARFVGFVWFWDAVRVEELRWAVVGSATAPAAPAPPPPDGTAPPRPPPAEGASDF